MSNTDSRSGLRYDSPDILRFVMDTHVPVTLPLAHAIRELQTHNMPQIQVAPADGRILQLLARLINARHVVEFGTLAGYSGLWLLSGMAADGHLYTVEAEGHHAEVANGVFVKAGYGDRVTILQRKALEALDELAAYAPFDLVFLDADKVNYYTYATWAFDHLRPGGLIVADNAYLFGYLAGKDPDGEWDAEAIENLQQTHRFIAHTCLSVCLPTPDGLLVGMKPDTVK